VRAVRASSERLGKALLVELVDGVAHRLRVRAEVAGYLVGVLPPGAGEKIWQRRKVKASVEDASPPPGPYARRRSGNARRSVVSWSRG
jgi:hypothetical protein